MRDPDLDAARERAHQLFRCSHDGMAYSDLDGRLIEVNEAFARLTGREAAELLATTYQAITPLEYHDLESRLVRSVVETGTPVVYEKEYLGKTGGRIPVWVSLFLLTTEDGRPSCLGAIVRGLSDRRLAEQALRHVQRVDSLRVLARGVSHDFNNVLGTVVGHLTLAKQATPAHGPSAEHVQRAIAATERAAALVDQLLVYAGSGEYRPLATDVNALVAELRPLLEPLVRSGRLSFELAAELPTIPVDRRQLQQLLANVVTNAAEAGGTDAVTVTIRTRVQDVAARERARWSRTGTLLAEGRYVVVEVADDGCGMSSETVSRVFDPFYSTKFIGRGLGLATALGVARAHHGGIDIESDPGRGTTLTVMLPCATAPRPWSAPAIAAPRASSAILVVEDEPDILSFASYVLRSAGYSVVSAVDGQDAVEVFTAEPDRFGLVFLDLSMPRMDGRDALRRLRALRPGLRVLLTSGYSTPDATAAFAPGELSGFLHKPYDDDALLAKIREALA
jgi:two-component system cell cycle sensor histidine kinase/response regulator CckA